MSTLSIPQSAFKAPRSSRSNSVSSSTSSSSSSSHSTKYVPLHKRAGSDRSSVASSSRPSSPTTSVRSSSPECTPGVYSIDALLAFRPLADEGMKQRMRDICPDVVMNRRMRKSLQYIALNPHLRISPPTVEQLDPHEEEEIVVESTPAVASTPSTQQQQRALPRRNRPARRPLERRLQDTWKGVRVPAPQSLTV